MADIRDIQEATNNLEDITIPSDIQSYDIVKDLKYVWTLNTAIAARSNAPKIIINLLQQDTGQINQLLGQGKTLVSDPYKGLYTVTNVCRLELPFFSEQHHSNQSTWEALSIGQTIETVTGGMGETISKAGKFVVGTATFLQKTGAAAVEPGYKVEAPRVWRDIGLETVSFGFPLYNKDLQTYQAHKRFVDDMIQFSLPHKRRFTFVTPPVLCEYEIPGVRRCLMAEFNVTVSLKGQSVYKDRSKANVPDAYDLTFSLKDLLMQTRNVHSKDGPITITDSNVKAYE